MWSLYNLVHSLCLDDERWALTGFFKPAYDMIQRLDRGLLYTPSKNASSILKQMLFEEVNAQWINSDDSFDTHLVHPIWKQRKLSIVHYSRATSVSLHKLVLGRGNTGQYLHRCKRAPTPFCKSFPNVIENLEHVFCNCPARCNKLVKLKTLCRNLNLTYDLPTLFTDTRTRKSLEIVFLELAL